MNELVERLREQSKDGARPLPKWARKTIKDAIAALKAADRMADAMEFEYSTWDDVCDAVIAYRTATQKKD